MKSKNTNSNSSSNKTAELWLFRRTCHWKWSIFRIHIGTRKTSCSASSRVYQKARKDFGEKLSKKKKGDGKIVAKNQENTIAELKATLEIQYVKEWKYGK